MADPPAQPAAPVALRHRLYVRVFVTVLASLTVAAGLFILAHLRYMRGSFPLGLFVLWMVIALAVALGAYPMVRRLTARLEHLQRSVEAWGAGRLSERVEVDGSDEIARLAASFNASAERIEALVGAQKTLLANVSHELRSPLARIRMAVELLHDRAAPEAREELARNIAELDQLIGELLLASRLEAMAQVERSTEIVDLTGLLAEECARADGALTAAPASVTGEARLLRRMVRNLLENAARHGRGTAVEVFLTVEKEAVRLRVCDGGLGVPEGERELVFEPFYRLDGASEADGGVGLGLSLVRQIARRHGGDVSCRERDGGGCCFEVVLPRVPSA